MEEIQYYWNKFSYKQKLRIKELLYINYDFTKDNIDRQIKFNIKKINSYIKDYENNKKKL